MRKIEKKKLTLKKINIASMQESQSIKGGSGNSCQLSCEGSCKTCSGKTHPIFSAIILVCLESVINC